MKKFLLTFGLAGLVLLGSNHAASAATNTYTVKSGDSLYRIAKIYKTSVNNLKKWNHLKSNIIHPKQKLAVYSSTKSASKKVQKASTSKSKKSKVIRSMTVTATAYTASCKRCSGITATGLNLRKNPKLKVISVDPRLIKLGTKVYVEGYGYAVAADTGGAMRGKKIDVFIPSKKKALQWGRKTVKVKILK
ncbi:3D domain-containing protein [Neobacillus sp. OS1-32]|uniref:LysM peptidoglycan-binding domain-containing protein n=1 Tax=Neobacillus paridis TaxID=2803862 RepID=A0ABS1TIQ7_9BACI|nr:MULTISPECIES: 3D domain-containing protein [Neobacillus]MBL4950914.1 LysM peptidoglycan-binding domain-containing protein [Neobacillus paridis]WML29998.1 3D domain-containing protein [Neobacillus sp. OS1-32]